MDIFNRLDHILLNINLAVLLTKIKLKSKNIKFDVIRNFHRYGIQYYYQNCQVAILIYNITRKESFDEIKFFCYNQLK